MRTKFYILIICQALTAVVYGRTGNAIDIPANKNVVVSDSIPEDESALGADTIKNGKNIAKGTNAMDYLLERRYLADGETFTKRWDDHLFVEAGAGVEQMVPPGAGYKFNALTVAHLGVGKQFSKLHSARVLLNGAFGYQQDKDRLYYRMGPPL